jgi:nucleotide-binding universal stress UspA family protein
MKGKNMTKKNLLFLTNFSEACFQAVPSIAEWMDREQGRLTLLHVADPGQKDSEQSESRLKSFFAEADRYRHCERVVLKGPRVQSMVDYCQAERPDVVFAPASKPSGLPRFLHSSLRAQLIREGGVRLWTRGRSEGSDNSARVPKQVVYAITGSAGWVSEAVEAAKFAARYEANLHYVYLAPWPDLHEGSLVTSISEEMSGVTQQEVRNLASQLAIQPEIHTGIGDSGRDLARLLKECRADVAFVGESHLIRRSFWRDQIDAELDGLDCEFVCYPQHPGGMVGEPQEERQQFLEPAQSR